MCTDRKGDDPSVLNEQKLPPTATPVCLNLLWSLEGLYVASAKVWCLLLSITKRFRYASLGLYCQGPNNRMLGEHRGIL